MAVSLYGVGTASFTCIDGAGPVSVPGLQVGDRIIWSLVQSAEMSSYQPPGSSFEAVVSIADQIQQKAGAGNIKGCTGEIVFARGSA